MDIDDILRQWLEVYCAGHKMPGSFRLKATICFNKIYELCKNNPELANIIKTNETIFRVYSIDYNKELLIDFDEKYYSFSNDIEGIKNVVHYDSFLKTDILILESKPREAINLVELLNNLYENYSSRYLCENEIISKLHREDILNIYYVKNSADIEHYITKGSKINLKDINRSCKDILKNIK